MGKMRKKKEKLNLPEIIIELLNKHAQHGYVKTIDNKLYHCITGPELLNIANDLIIIYKVLLKSKK